MMGTYIWRMSNMLPKNFKSAMAQREQGDEESKFNIKEVGYLLHLVEGSRHEGQALELALICKMKLQKMLDKLTKHME